MIVTAAHAKAPLRLGLAGGGTDVSPFSDLYGGLVLNATISLFTHCEVRRRADRKVCFHAADFAELVEFAVDSPNVTSGPLQLHFAVYKKMVERFNGGEPLSVDVITYSDAPPGSGVGSSSGLVVAMIRAYCELLGVPLGEYDLAHLAYEIERIDCGMSGGKQDQYAATFGGFNFMEFSANDRVIINPLRVRQDLVNELESRLLLYFTGQSRESARIIDSQIAGSKDPSGTTIAALMEIKRAAIEMKDALLVGEVSTVLRILGSSWESKKKAAAAITNSRIDMLAETATAAGATAVKISGAGGGGFMMIAAEPADRYSVIRSLQDLGGRFFAFSFVFEGTQSWKRDLNQSWSASPRQSPSSRRS